LSRMTLASQYSAAAYCPDNNNSPGTTITCDPGQACPLISSSPNITSIHEFENLGEAGMTGVIILDHTHRTIALAFRGSSSTSNWRACFLVEPVPWEDLCRGCRVHAGFRNAWDAARVQAEFWLRRAVREHPDYLLVIAGHSFGGAVAMLAAADLRRQRELGKALLFTFGPPRVGNAELARYLEGSGGNFRFTHGADPVPHLP
ncbi:alpha/beta-hydrolase, partial [Glonium stellatum]